MKENQPRGGSNSDGGNTGGLTKNWCTEDWNVRLVLFTKNHSVVVKFEGAKSITTNTRYLSIFNIYLVAYFGLRLGGDGGRSMLCTKLRKGWAEGWHPPRAHGSGTSHSMRCPSDFRLTEIGTRM